MCVLKYLWSELPEFFLLLYGILLSFLHLKKEIFLFSNYHCSQLEPHTTFFGLCPVNNSFLRTESTINSIRKCQFQCIENIRSSTRFDRTFHAALIFPFGANFLAGDPCSSQKNCLLWQSGSLNFAAHWISSNNGKLSISAGSYQLRHVNCWPSSWNFQPGDGRLQDRHFAIAWSKTDRPQRHFNTLSKQRLLVPERGRPERWSILVTIYTSSTSENWSFSRNCICGQKKTKGSRLDLLYCVHGHRLYWHHGML